MSKAKYYIYRNLNRGDNFSVKYKGKVIGYIDNVVLRNVKFQVSDAGRKRCLATKERNVHAYIVMDDKPPMRYQSTQLRGLDPNSTNQIKYNPYKYPHFFDERRERKLDSAYAVLLYGGKAFVIDPVCPVIH